MSLADPDAALAAWLRAHTAALPEPPVASPVKPLRHNAPKIENLHGHLMRLTGGTDPTVLPCIHDRTLLALVAETGLDLTKWPTKQHFRSWLGLAPRTDRSGKRRRNRRQRHTNRAGQIFREAAHSLGRSKHLALAGFYRRLRTRRGPQIANMAAARKLAGLYYDLLRYGSEYVEHGLAQYEQQYKRQQIERLTKQAHALGLQIVVA